MYRPIALLLLILFTCCIRPAAAESDASVVVRQLSDQLIEVMKQGRALGFKGRLDKLHPTVASAYDMVAMAKGSLGVAATKLSSEDLGRLADAYTRYSVAVYADQFADWDGERFEVGRQRPATDGMVVVPSQIFPAHGAPTEIDYVMHQDGGRWSIVDVLFDGTVSELAVHRSQFVPVFRKDGLVGLIKMLDDKSAALGSAR